MIPDEDVIEDVLKKIEVTVLGVWMGDGTCTLVLVRLEVCEAVVAELAMLSLLDRL